MSVAVVLVAAGNGERLGRKIPKALVEVSNKPLLFHALEALAGFTCDQVIVVGHAEYLSEFAAITNQFPQLSVSLIAGGSSRQQSVAAGVALVWADLVLVHDAARCFAPASLFAQVKAGLKNSICVVPLLPISDTVKRIQNNLVIDTINRAELGAAQTPQGFRTEELRTALNVSKQEFTDEAALVQLFGHEVAWVQGDVRALKITTASDLQKVSQHQDLLTGIGVDAHEFSDSGELLLGCLAWPELPKLMGHSDGDAIAHAVVDALLSAAGLGDIGSNFGVDKPEYQGASGEIFIRETLDMIGLKNLTLVNVAIQVVADRPKIGPRRLELEQRLSSILGVPVSVGATTTDGLGFLSDSRGIAAVATALLAGRG